MQTPGRPSVAIVAIVAVVVAALSGACATTTTITTEKPGAEVIRQSDKEVLGVTPYAYTTQMWLWESEKLDVKDKRGQVATVELKRSEVDMVPMAGGACLTLTGCGAIAGIPLILAGGMMLPKETPVSFEKSGKDKSAAVVDDEDADAVVADNDIVAAADDGAVVY